VILFKILNSVMKR